MGRGFDDVNFVGSSSSGAGEAEPLEGVGGATRPGRFVYFRLTRVSEDAGVETAFFAGVGGGAGE